MTSADGSVALFEIVIAGGGVAALEAALALRQLGAEHFNVTLVAPNAEFVYRPLTVREPFAYGAARRYSIGEIANELGIELLVDRFAWLDATQRVAHTEAGVQIHYDALILALGAQPRAHFEHAVTIDDQRLDDLLHGLIQDVEGGYVHHVAFVIPPRMAWPLPIYEIALMTARRAFDMNAELTVTIATPEDAPLSIFGDGAATAVSRLLASNRITTITSATSDVPDGRHVIVNPGDQRLDVDRVIALPELYGPAVRGLPASENGFIAIDLHGRVRGVERVYAAGDATDFAVKHGGIAAQQADTAAQAIAAIAGLPVEPTPLHPVIHGILLTGAAPLYMSAQIVDGRGFGSEITEKPTWSPATKIAARYLSPYLDARDLVGGMAPA
jgi:sulfide:quinone oxidoreductase